ncbi:uncharacterized protein METZ01_LOCUS11739 [marine metagenome]|uniref:Uncharacterized protein n=1 Tax=marine metagenome TaxID=408172 RepID=A0A381NW94_9ZZZZ
MPVVGFWYGLPLGRGYLQLKGHRFNGGGPFLYQPCVSKSPRISDNFQSNGHNAEYCTNTEAPENTAQKTNRKKTDNAADYRTNGTCSMDWLASRSLMLST